MAPGSRARKGASVALYYLAQSPGSAQGLAGAMMELGCGAESALPVWTESE